MHAVSILEQFKLDGKTALVTGARRGIGKAMAVALAEAGADIVATSASLDAGESEVRGEVEAHGSRFWGYSCDLSDRPAVYSFIETVRRDCPPIDILVNNAGTVLRKPAEEHSDEYWDKVIDVNLNAQFVLAREFGKGMLQRGAGKIIFTASLLSFQGGITVPGYAAAKGGVAQLTKALANEWAGRNVQVNAIAPGYIVTDNTTALRDDPVRYPAILSRIPAGRWGDPRDLAGAVVFLASPASDYVSGTVLTVDGGWMGR
jgi:2-dehydro-3-deoxy-D-gluconate 5-dehydrogenase